MFRGTWDLQTVACHSLLLFKLQIYKIFRTQFPPAAPQGTKAYLWCTKSRFVSLYLHFLRQFGECLSRNFYSHFPGCSELVDHKRKQLLARLDSKHIIRIHHICFSDQYKPLPDILGYLIVHHFCDFRPLIGERVEHATISKVDVAIVPVSLNIQNVAQVQVEHFTFIFDSQNHFLDIIVFFRQVQSYERFCRQLPPPHVQMYKIPIWLYEIKL